MEFDAFDWMEVSGQKVAIIRIRRPFSPFSLLNYEVSIDGKKFKIIDVRRYNEVADDVDEVGLTVESI